MVDNTIIDKSEINAILNRIVIEENTDAWWSTPMDKLDGLSPNEVWELGKRETILKIVLSYLRPLAYS